MPIDFDGIDLKEFPLFQGVEPEVAKAFLNMGFSFSYEAGTPLVVNNDLGETFFLLLSGTAKLMLANVRKEDVHIALFRAGDFFGELSMLEPKPARTANVIAVSDVEVVAIQKKEFHRMMLHYPILALNIARVLGQRLRSMNERMVAERLPSEQKVALTLLTLSKKGKTMDGESLTVLLPRLSLKEWALFCYVTPDVFMEVMEKYRQEGILEFQNQRIVLKNLEFLRRHAEASAIAVSNDGMTQ